MTNAGNWFSKEKIEIETTIFSNQSNEPFTWKDIKHIEFQDDDVVKVGYSEPYYTDNNSSDGYFYVEVTRMVLETDEEFNERIKENELMKAENKKRRYENFLKMKAEFEPEEPK